MATKKTTPKKTTVRKRSASVKKTTPKKNAASTRGSLRRHIGLQSEDTDFMTFKITRQTVYWLVLGAVVILFTVWLMKLQSDIQTLYDQIDTNTAEMSLL